MNVFKELNVNSDDSKMRNEKFKATKMWNEIVYAFYIGIPLEKHRRNMKSHYDCFVASEAINWLHHYLQMSPYFGNNEISRFQALNLLRKFAKSGIIENVNGISDDFVKDNKDLYRFTRDSHENMPFIMDETPNSSLCKNTETNKSDSIRNAQSKNEHSSLLGMTKIWKYVYLKHANLVIPQFNEFINADHINATVLMHNFTRINKSGVVQLTDKSEDLPHWIVSAMKCLAKWPTASGNGSCLPKYPGFEADVFNVIREYFVNLGIPLIPALTYRLIIQIYDAYRINGGIHEFNDDPTLNSPISDLRQNFPSFVPLNDPNLMNEYTDDQFTSTPLASNSPQIYSHLPPNHVFETIFTDENPVTKIISISELTSLFGSNCDINCGSASDRVSQSLHRARSMGKLNESDKSYGKGEDKCYHSITTLPRKSNKRKIPNIKTPPQNDRFCYDNFGFAMQSPTEDGEYMMDKNVSSLSATFYYSVPDDNDDNLSIRVAQSSTTSSQRMKIKDVRTSRISVSYEAIRALQLSLFSLPSPNRRQLHLLLRLLSKIIQNKDIVLFTDENISIKQYIIEIFTRSIICSEKECEYDELKCNRIVEILIDHCKELFKVPLYIENEVKSLIQKNQNDISDDSIDAPMYCQRITPEEFELQREVLSLQSLAELFRNIMMDNKLKYKEKLKIIKQFKQYHPEVYNWFFKTEINCDAENNIQNVPQETVHSTKHNFLKFLFH